MDSEISQVGRNQHDRHGGHADKRGTHHVPAQHTAVYGHREDHDHDDDRDAGHECQVGGGQNLQTVEQSEERERGLPARMQKGEQRQEGEWTPEKVEQLNVAELRYKVEVARMAADMRKDDREHWFTAWMVPTAFAIFILHVAAIVFDSIPVLGHEVGTWGVSKLPGIYADMQYNIVMTICGVAGIGAIKKIFSR